MQAMKLALPISFVVEDGGLISLPLLSPIKKECDQGLGWGRGRIFL